MGFVGERAVKRDAKIRRPVIVFQPFRIMSSSWLIRALCKWKVLDTVLATLGCSRQRLQNSLIFTLSNVSVDGGVEIFKLACLVGKADVVGIN